MISNLDLGLIVGGGFVAVSIIMGIIAYASMQTMKSVKADSHWKELVFWGNKGELNLVNQPTSLKSLSSRILLPAPPATKLMLSGTEMVSISPIALPRDSLAPKQEVIAWSSPNPVMPTLRNDFADPDPSPSSSPISFSQPPAAPDPFEDDLETKPVRMPKLPSQQYKIVIQNGAKNNNKRINKAGQVRQRINKNIQQQRRKESKQEEVKGETSAITSLPAPPPPIEDAIELIVNETDHKDTDEIATPVISKRNIKNLMSKGRRL